MAYIDFILKTHRATKRDYAARAVDPAKAECATIAGEFGRDYWDGDRKYGFGGYRYDGRWKTVAEEMIRHYGLKPNSSILDVGCGKGFLLYEFTRLLPAAKVSGIDISDYAIANAKEEVRPFLKVGNAVTLPYPDKSFDFVVSVLTLHNLYNYELDAALREIERVSRGPKHVIVETYRNEREKVNFLNWQLTCRSFYTPKEWEWVFAKSGYTGDYSYIVFE